MPFAVGVTLDSAAAAKIKNLSKRLLEAISPEHCSVSDAPPHLTFAIADQVNVFSVKQLLTDLAGQSPAVRVRFDSFGVFPGEKRVLFLAPVVTAELLAFHGRFHRAFGSHAWHQSDFYLPDNWVPHCTIASELSAGTFARAAEACFNDEFPREARLTHISLTEFREGGNGTNEQSKMHVMLPLAGTHST